jgi:hypothetical protein
MLTGLRTRALSLMLAVASVAVASCGGGGGGGGEDSSDNYPGYTDFQLERDSLDSGDLTDVTLTVYDINPNGIFVKFHYPSSLRFVAGSAMSYSGDAQTWQTTAPLTATSVGSEKYLVFTVSPPPPNQTNRVALSFTMKAVSGDQSAYLEVDLDNNDPQVPDRLEFSANDPQFTSDDRWNISIGGAVAPTPTPAATGSATPAPTGSATPAATATPKK